MAIAIDATSSGSGSAGTTLTFAHTCSGADRLLAVCVGAVDSTTISGVTYNGVALTRAIQKSSGMLSEIWILEDPATGSNNIVITKTSGAEVDAGAVSFTGADTYDATGNGSGTGTSQSVTTNTNYSGNGYVVSMTTINDPGTITYGGAGTNWAENEAGGFGASYAYQAFASGANISESWTSANSRSWTAAGVEIKEVLSFRPVIMMF